MLSEMSRSLTFEQEHYAHMLSPLLRKQLDAGKHIPYQHYSEDLKAANRSREIIAEVFQNQVDILITPSAVGEAPLLKEGTGDLLFCRIWTLLGLPCINVNISTGSNGLPIGIQLIAGPGKDGLLLSVARVFALALPDPVLRDQA